LEWLSLTPLTGCTVMTGSVRWFSLPRQTSGFRPRIRRGSAPCLRPFSAIVALEFVTRTVAFCRCCLRSGRCRSEGLVWRSASSLRWQRGVCARFSGSMRKQQGLLPRAHIMPFERDARKLRLSLQHIAAPQRPLQRHNARKSAGRHDLQRQCQHSSAEHNTQHRHHGNFSREPSPAHGRADCDLAHAIADDSGENGVARIP
jgi:hypothetical protein